MGMTSGDGYYQEVDESRYSDDEIDAKLRETIKQTAESRFNRNAIAKVGTTIECACCGKKIVKKTYQQKFCPPVKSKRGKRYICKDRYHNIMNPERAARARNWS